MPTTLIPVESLPEGVEHTEDAELIRVPMNSEERCRVRRRLQAPDGATFALALPTGTRLQPGQILYAAENRVYVISAAPEDVLVVHPRDLKEAARAAHLIGNLHRDIDLEGAGIAVLWDEPLAERLQRAGFAVERARRPFLGNPPSEHTH